MEKQLNIGFGVMAPTLGNQLREQGFKFNKEEIAKLQEHADRIIHLKMASLLTDNESKKVRDRLFKKISTHVKAQNKPNS